MDAFVSTFIKMSLRGIVIILVVLFVRFLLKKLEISHKYILGLWAMVFLFFIFPWKLSLPVGFWNNANIPEEVRVIAENLSGAGDTEAADDAVNVVNPSGGAKNITVGMPAVPTGDIVNPVVAKPVEPAEQSMQGMNEEKNHRLDQKQIEIMLFLFWLVGLSGFIGHMLYSYYTIKKKLQVSVLYQDNIWWIEDIDIPMVFGLIRPRIYVPISMESENLTYVIAHEKMHIKRKDGLFKMVTYIICLIHWFNPFIWIAYFLFGSDMEKACDEEVIRGMEKEKRKEYAYALLHIAAENGRRKKRVFVAPICFDEGNVKSRIKNVMKYKYTLPGIGALVVIVILSLSALFLTEAKAAGQEGPEQKVEKMDESGEGTLDGSGEAIKHTPPESNNNTSDLLPTDSINNPNELDVQTYSEILVENLSDIEKGYKSSYTVSYTTNLIKGGNHYWIDENGCLWGTGTTEYGQLGNLDESLSKVFEPVAIAENVVHVDYSGEYFLIYVTSDHKLYGMGGNAAGILDPTSIDYRNGSYMNVLTSPVLLMENVIYAKCGYSTIIALQENGDVYVLGNNYYVPFVSESYVAPQKVMENAKYVTSYIHSYAAIDENNSLWTWGNNKLGQCGIGFFSDEIVEPQKILDDVACAWMGKVAFNSSGEVNAHDCLIALKVDGSALGCGEGIGNEVSALEGINNFDVQHSQKEIASANLIPIQFREFVPFSLQGVELYWSEEELIQFLEANGIEYHTGYTYEDHYLLYSANNGEWEFIFDSSGQLAVITNTKTDEIERNMLKSGDSLEQAIDSYGRNYVVRNQQYNYSELVYDMDGYSFVIGGYSDLGCAKFSVEISGFMN